jgi:hypothetical protein
LACVKRPAREVDYLTPSSAEVKNEWSSDASPSVCLHVVDWNNFNGTQACVTGNITEVMKNRGSFHYPLNAETIMIAFFCDVSYIDVSVDSATFIFMVDNHLP